MFFAASFLILKFCFFFLLLFFLVRFVMVFFLSALGSFRPTLLEKFSNGSTYPDLNSKSRDVVFSRSFNTGWSCFSYFFPVRPRFLSRVSSCIFQKVMLTLTLSIVIKQNGTNK